MRKFKFTQDDIVQWTVYVILFTLGVGAGTWYGNHTKSITPPIALDRILPEGYTIAGPFDELYWGKDGDFPNNSYPDYVQALKGGQRMVISGPHRSHFAFATYQDGTYGMFIGVESEFEDQSMALYRLPSGEWRFDSISSDFKKW